MGKGRLSRANGDSTQDGTKRMAPAGGPRNGVGEPHATPSRSCRFASPRFGLPTLVRSWRMTDFATLPLKPALLASLDAHGYAAMTPVQAQSLPPILAGRDVIA